jgi:hypothetical protein
MPLALQVSKSAYRFVLASAPTTVFAKSQLRHHKGTDRILTGVVVDGIAAMLDVALKLAPL